MHVHTTITTVIRAAAATIRLFWGHESGERLLEVWQQRELHSLFRRGDIDPSDEKSVKRAMQVIGGLCAYHRFCRREFNMHYQTPADLNPDASGVMAIFSVEADETLFVLPKKIHSELIVNVQMLHSAQLLAMTLDSERAASLIRALNKIPYEPSETYDHDNLLRVSFHNGRLYADRPRMNDYSFLRRLLITMNEPDDSEAIGLLTKGDFVGALAKAKGSRLSTILVDFLVDEHGVADQATLQMGT